jgi:hypothetical protein
MSIKRGKLAINLKGTVESVGPTLIAIGASFGLVIWEQSVPLSGPAYKYYEVDQVEPGAPPLALGVIVLEQFVQQHVVMIFGSISDWLDMEAVKAEYVESFWDFIEAMLQQLLVLGYVQSIDPQPYDPNALTPYPGSHRG